MKRILGILILFVIVYAATAIMAADANADFLSAFTQKNLLRRIAPIGILGIGVAFVILTGGIDLSLGSMVCLIGVGTAWLLTTVGWPIWLVLPLALFVSAGIGLFHGVLITRLRLQPFVVTLCGLLMYRGITRGFTQDQTAGFGTGFTGLRKLAKGEIPLPLMEGFALPVPFVLMLIVAVVAAIFLNKTVGGRHLMALGNNEEAARLSGVNTAALTVLAYVICSVLAGFAGLLHILDVGLEQPATAGNFFELFAIAAAVLGGCSLRGGTGTIAGVVIGTALIQLLRQMITIVFPRQQSMEYLMLGAVLLVGVIADELVRRAVAKRRAARAV